MVLVSVFCFFCLRVFEASETCACVPTSLVLGAVFAEGTVSPHLSVSLKRVCLLTQSPSLVLRFRFKDTIINAKYGGHTEAVRRLLGQLPISAQSYSGSPYLDLSLFSYDDKWVSVMERPKTCGDHPIRYTVSALAADWQRPALSPSFLDITYCHCVLSCPWAELKRLAV